MRPLLVLIIAGVILGGVQAFLASDRSTPVASHAPIEQRASVAKYDLEVTLTFDAGPDAFSLGAGNENPSLLVQLNGQPVLERTDTIPATESPLIVRDVQGVILGRNELYVQASPTDSSKQAAMRLRILSDGEPMAEQTIWPDFGGLVQGTVTMEVSQ